MNEHKSVKPLISLALAGTMAIAIGIWVGITFDFQHKKTECNTALSGEVDKLGEILKSIAHDYVDDVTLTTLSKSAITAILQKLDPHSTYATAEELTFSNVALQGELEGIGIEFRMLDDTVHVIAPISGGPSAQAGIKAGDKIMKVDDQPFAGQKLGNIEVVKKLRGPKGTQVKLTVQRGHADVLLDFMVTRARIPVHSVDISYMIDQQVGYVKVNRFTPHTFKEFKSAFSALQKQGMQKLLLDLRGNPGGYLNVAIQMADHVLTQGQLIVYTQGKKRKYSNKYYAKGKDQFVNNPIIVLIDEGSASASEIIAGAWQDNDRALVVGRKSFGKGLVQRPIQLQDGSQLCLTVARYYTPSGRFIQKPYKAEAVDTKDANREEAIFFQSTDANQKEDQLIREEEVKYKTTKGRTVCGGGGIVPDHLVLSEKHSNYSYFDQLISHSVLQEYALAYLEAHRAYFLRTNLVEYHKKFSVDTRMLQKIVAQAKTKGVQYDDQSFRVSRALIKRFLKALIAKHAWGKQGFYFIDQENDQMIQKALQLFGEAEALVQK